MPVTDQVRVQLMHELRSRWSFGTVTRRWQIAEAPYPVERFENEESAVQMSCPECGRVVTIGVGSMARVRRTQQIATTMLVVSIVVLIASAGYLIGVAGQVQPEGAPTSPLLVLSVIGLAVGFVVAGLSASSRRYQCVQTLAAERRSGHSASGFQVPGPSGAQPGTLPAP